MMSPRTTCTDEWGWEVGAVGKLEKGHVHFSASFSPSPSTDTHTHTHRHTHIFNKEPEADSILTPFPQRTPWERGCKRGQRGSWGGDGAAFSPGYRQSMHLPGRDLARQVSGELGWGGGGLENREPGRAAGCCRADCSQH